MTRFIPHAKAWGFLAQKALRQKFWIELLEIAKQKNTFFSNISPGYNSWISKGSGKTGICYSFTITQKDAGIEAYIDTKSKEQNKQWFDLLLQRKTEIERAFGQPLDWQRLDSKRACRICYKFIGIGLNQKDKWSLVQNEMVDKMKLLEEVMREHIDKLEPTLTNRTEGNGNK